MLPLWNSRVRRSKLIARQNPIWLFQFFFRLELDVRICISFFVYRQTDVRVLNYGPGSMMTDMQMHGMKNAVDKKLRASIAQKLREVS